MGLPPQLAHQNDSTVPTLPVVGGSGMPHVLQQRCFRHGSSAELEQVPPRLWFLQSSTSSLLSKHLLQYHGAPPAASFAASMMVKFTSRLMYSKSTAAALRARSWLISASFCSTVAFKLDELERHVLERALELSAAVTGISCDSRSGRW